MEPSNYFFYLLQHTQIPLGLQPGPGSLLRKISLQIQSPILTKILVFPLYIIHIYYTLIDSGFPEIGYYPLFIPYPPLTPELWTQVY